MGENEKKKWPIKKKMRTTGEILPMRYYFLGVRVCVCVCAFKSFHSNWWSKTREDERRKKKKKWQTKLRKRGREGKHAEKRNSGPCPREVQRGMREWNSNATYAPAKMKLTAAYVFLWLHTLFLQKEKKKSKAPLFHAFTRNMER